MTPFQINSFYSVDDLYASGYEPFKASIDKAMVFTKDGAVYFFKRYPCHDKRVKFMLASSL